jgi:hypothetical protein
VFGSIADYVHTLAGFAKLGAKPYTHTIKVLYLTYDTMMKMVQTGDIDEDLWEESDLIELFIRRPPYEPLVEKPLVRVVIRGRSEEVRGTHVWVIKPETRSGTPSDIIKARNNNYLTALEHLRTFLSNYTNVNQDLFKEAFILGDGRLDKHTRKVWLKTLIIPSVIGNVRGSEVRVELDKAKIVYGIDSKITGHILKKLSKRIQFGSINLSKQLHIKYYSKRKIDEWRRELEDLLKDYQNLASILKIRYDITDFNYVTYCRGGKYITTHPLAPSPMILCPDCYGNQVVYCGKAPGYKLMHYRRRVFPKTYTDFTINANLSIEKVPIPLTASTQIGIRVDIVANGVSLYLPGLGNKVDIKFHYKPYSVLDYSNGLFIHIPYSMAYLLLDILVCSARAGKNVKTIRGNSDMLKLLITKFLFAEGYMDIFNVSSFFDIETDEKTGMFKIKENKNMLNSLKITVNDIYSGLIKGNLSSGMRDKLTEYIAKVLSHTIAHIMYIVVKESPDIPEENVVYVNNFDAKRNLYAGIIEKSVYGVLNLGKELEEYVTSSYCDKLPGCDLETAARNMITKYFEDSETDFVRTFIQDGRDAFKIQSINALNSYVTPIAGVPASDQCSMNIVRKLVERLREIVRGIYESLRSSSLGIEPDFTIFQFVVEGLRHRIMDHLKWYLMALANNYGLKLDEEEAGRVIDDFLRDTLLDAIIAEGPLYCLDGCSFNIYLDKECNEGINENLVVSWELLRLFLCVSGLLHNKPGQQLCPSYYCATSAGLRRLIQSATERILAVTAFIDDRALDELERALERGVRVEIEVDGRNLGKNIEDRLQELAKKYPDKFCYSIAGRNTASTHEKMLIIDDLKILGSWNLLVGAPPKVQQKVVSGPVRQSYSAEILDKENVHICQKSN